MSKNSLSDMLEEMLVVGKIISIKRLRIIIFDVGAGLVGKKILESMAKLGGENVEYYSVQDTNLEKIFNHISVDVGLVKKQEVQGVVKEG